MKNPVRILSLLILLFSFIKVMAQLPEGYQETHRKKQNINLDWKFKKDNASKTPADLNMDDADWETVSIPHNPDPVSLELDSVKESWIQKDFMRDISWYRKEMVITRTGDEKVFIEFEGVHTVTEMWIDGQFVGRHDIGGYIPFHFDITEFVSSGEKHSLIIKADNTQDPTISPDPHRTDYVKFGGIYRDLYLVTTHKLHVNFNWEDYLAGVHITTPSVRRRNGTVSVRTTVVNEMSEEQECGIVTKIIDANGYVLHTLKNSHPILSKGQYTFSQTIGITENYQRWSPDNPYLYRVVSYIYKGDELVDFVENKFGFRKIELIDGVGFVLNDEPFFMIGVNRHHNYPHIGDAVPNSMHYEEALRFKEAGINTIRLSHYPQDDAFIEACDELGLLVYEEPATWIDWEEGEWMDKLEQSLRVVIRNHRNHPSIVIWGAGINHRGPVPGLQYVVDEEDTDRLTASASSAWNGVKNAGVTDIYATMDYRETDWPQGDFCLVMEHGCSPSSEANQYHISRYKQRKNNIGAIAWVGADYNHLQPENRQRDFYTGYGVLTMYRHKRPVYYWYQSEMNAEPMVHIADETVSKNGKVRVFSNAFQVALYADGKLVGIQSPDNSPERLNVNHPSFTFYYQWENEELKAVALNRGETIAYHVRKKPGEPYAINLAVDYPEIRLVSGGSDMKMIRAFIVDKNGEIVTEAKNKVHFTIDGAGELVYTDKFYIDEMDPLLGVATVYIRGTGSAGDINVKASSQDLKSGSLELESIVFKDDEIANNATPIYDYPEYKIDIGGEGQFVQFDWKGWSIDDVDDLEYSTNNGVHFTISADSSIQWSTGEPVMLGDLSFMGADGVYVHNTGLTLGINGLGAGTYMLETYHHARLHEEQFPYRVKINLESASQDISFISDDHIVGYYQNNDVGERAPISVKNKIISNGKDEIQLIFKTNRDNSYTWLNGLVLKRIE